MSRKDEVVETQVYGNNNNELKFIFEKVKTVYPSKF